MNDKENIYNNKTTMPKSIRYGRSLPPALLSHSLSSHPTIPIPRHFPTISTNITTS